MRKGSRKKKSPPPLWGRVRVGGMVQLAAIHEESLSLLCNLH